MSSKFDTSFNNFSICFFLRTYAKMACYQYKKYLLANAVLKLIYMKERKFIK